MAIPIVGVGLSRRANCKATDISIYPYIRANLLSYSISKLFYKNPLNKGFYGSIGAGGFVGNIYTFPIAGGIVPVRAGYEGEHGFIDIGVEFGGLYVISPFVMPQLRAGFKF